MKRPERPSSPPRPAAATRKALRSEVDKHAADDLNAAIEIAKAGDTGLLKALLDRIAPPRREATIAAALPAIKSPADLHAAAAALVSAVADVAITPSEGQALATLLEAYRKQNEHADREARIAKLEEAAAADITRQAFAGISVARAVKANAN